jgi:transcriptional regulator with XRE-family HTH domain
MIHIELKERCSRVRLTQSELALKLQVSPKAITNYFNGKQANADYLTKTAYKECIEQAIKRREWELKQSKTNKNQ